MEKFGIWTQSLPGSPQSAIDLQMRTQPVPFSETELTFAKAVGQFSLGHAM